jgi:hypothetical protein
MCEIESPLNYARRPKVAATKAGELGSPKISKESPTQGSKMLWKSKRLGVDHLDFQLRKAPSILNGGVRRS